MNLAPRRLMSIGAAISMCSLLIVGCDFGQGRRLAEQARSQVRRIAADLDRQTTQTGVYVREKAGEINERDPWGTPIQVSYSQGGVAEVISVRSAGPDREFQTRDDEVAQGIATNLKGIGEGIKKNAGETAASVAKGVVKGTVAGVKETVKESWPFKKKKPEKKDTTDAKPDAKPLSQP